MIIIPNKFQRLDAFTKIGLRVPEVTSASIKGLQGLKFVDKTVEGTPTLDEAREEVSA